MPTKLRRSSRRSNRAQQAFSLVEVALALGIVGFALAGLIGVLPLAANIGRQSVVQGRAASVANTMFANFRAQSFSAVQYLDAAPSGTSGTSGTSSTPTINLDTATTGSSVTFFAYFDEVATNVPADDERRLHFVSSQPTGMSSYQIVLRFNNQPAGTLTPYTASSGSLHAQANAIEATILATDHPKDVYHFSSVVANRAE